MNRRALHLNAKIIMVMALMVIVVAAIIGGLDLINGGLVQPDFQPPSEGLL